MHPSSDGCSTIRPIVQALAPYLLAGCCAVNGLVPRALFMVVTIIAQGTSFVNDRCIQLIYLTFQDPSEKESPLTYLVTDAGNP